MKHRKQTLDPSGTGRECGGQPMKSQIAKQNPVLMQQAIKHYLNNAKGKETPVFTFMSFHDDNEPYHLAELITCLSETDSDWNQIGNTDTEVFRIKQLPQI